MRKFLVLALVVVVLPGCSLFIPPNATVEPQVSLAKKTLLVVPFSDAQHAYFDSPDGSELAQLVVREVRLGAPKARVVEPDELRRIYAGQNLESLGWQTVGQAVKADYVLVGSIRSFTLRDPHASNLMLGEIALDLKVVSVADGSTVYFPTRAESTFRWSDTGDSDIGTPEFDITPEEVREGTLQVAARRIGDVFCPRQITQAESSWRQHPRGRMFSP